MRILTAAVVAGVAGLALQAETFAQRSLQFDINVASVLAKDNTSTGSALSLGFSGTVQLGFTSGQTKLEGIFSLVPGIGGTSTVQPYTGTLTDFLLTVNLTSGNVTGGSLKIDSNGGSGAGGDTYSATIGAGGSLSAFVGGGFILQGLSQTGSFSDSNFQGVDVSDFSGNSLTGAFLSFRLAPNAKGMGFADAEVFVNNVPTPASLSLLGAAGMVMGRRRRR
jgi:hypothetical protein